MEKKTTAVVVLEFDEVAMEITQEELNLLLRKREKDVFEAKRQGYISELNNLLARAKADGFTIATEEVKVLHKAKAWPDIEGKWIKVE